MIGDISVPLRSPMPTWPGSVGLTLTQAQRLARGLAGVAPGPWELLCRPLRLVGADGAPARTVLRRGLLPHAPADHAP